MRVFRVTFLLVFACGPARSPSQEDACRDDDGCASGLVCCHADEDRQTSSRGFCVKRSVCNPVSAPSQPPLPQSD